MSLHLCRSFNYLVSESAGDVNHPYWGQKNFIADDEISGNMQNIQAS